MAPTEDIARKLRKFMNDHGYTKNDIYRGLIPIINGRMGKGIPQGRKPQIEANALENCAS